MTKNVLSTSLMQQTHPPLEFSARHVSCSVRTWDLSTCNCDDVFMGLVKCRVRHLRMGKMEGFKNIKRAQVHSLGTSGMMKCAMNVHENVPGFKEASNRF